MRVAAQARTRGNVVHRVHFSGVPVPSALTSCGVWAVFDKACRPDWRRSQRRATWTEQQVNCLECIAMEPPEDLR